MALATPIADLFPAETFEKVNLPLVVALVLILVASFVLGLIAKAPFGRRFGEVLERKTVGALPLYGVLKSISRNLVQMGDSSAFKPAMLGSESSRRELVFLIEDHGDGHGTVLVPRAPTPLVGTILIVPMDTLELLDAPFGDVTRVLSHWGVGTRELLGTRNDGPG